MLRLGTFRIDGTPPVGQGTGFGLTDSTRGVRDPLYLRGYLLSSDKEECLIVASDWCGLMNSALRELTSALAEGAGVPAQHVIVHSSHQHDAPLFDFEIELLLGRPTFSRSFWESLLVSAQKAARDARARMAPVAETGHAETRLWGYGSSRDVVGRDGTFLGNRWSRTTEAALVAAPVGTIDPMLRTVAFKAPDGRVSASLSFYASHPQVASGSGTYSADAPGEAMRIVSGSLGTSDHAHFMGCAGNVTAGKYTSASDLEGNLRLFGKRLADGILRNHASMSWEPAGPMSWRTASFPFPAAMDKLPRLKAELADPSVATQRKHIAAPVISAMTDPHNTTYVLSRLALGEASILFFPGEPFVEYQLFAQSLEPDRFIAAAGNCGDSFLYLPRTSSFTLGGYEVQSFCWCTPEIETRLEEAIREVLA